jgi:hypothetical protein
LAGSIVDHVPRNASETVSAGVVSCLGAEGVNREAAIVCSSIKAYLALCAVNASKRDTIGKDNVQLLAGSI